MNGQKGKIDMDSNQDWCQHPCPLLGHRPADHTHSLCMRHSNQNIAGIQFLTLGGGAEVGLPHQLSIPPH